MGLLDLPGPLFQGVDDLLAVALPGLIRLLLWGVTAGLLTMLAYRRLSNQDRIQALKVEQRAQQREIADFDGELAELFPMIRHTLGLGMRQLGLSLGPALLATVPVLFLIVWVAGAFGYDQPQPGETVEVRAYETEQLAWEPAGTAAPTEHGWVLTWPEAPDTVRLVQSGLPLLQLPAEQAVPVIHKRLWWNWLVANPLGYLPEAATVEQVEIALPAQQFLGFGPAWMRGWMFSFFLSFLLSSVAFKVLLRID